MIHTDYLHLLSERETVRSLLADTLEEDLIDLYSLQGRLAQIEATIKDAQADEQAPALPD